MKKARKGKKKAAPLLAEENVNSNVDIQPEGTPAEAKSQAPSSLVQRVIAAVSRQPTAPADEESADLEAQHQTSAASPQLDTPETASAEAMSQAPRSLVQRMIAAVSRQPTTPTDEESAGLEAQHQTSAASPQLDTPETTSAEAKSQAPRSLVQRMIAAVSRQPTTPADEESADLEAQHQTSAASPQLDTPETTPTATPPQSISPSAGDRNEAAYNELNDDSPEGEEQPDSVNRWERERSNLSSPHVAVNFGENKSTEIFRVETPEMIIARHKCRFRLYQGHGFAGILGEGAYSYFSYAMGVLGTSLTIRGIAGVKPDDIALKVIMGGILTPLSFVANGSMFSPTKLARNTVIAYDKDPTKTFSHSAKNNRILTLLTAIHFAAGAYANVDQLDETLEDWFGPGKPAFTTLLMYMAFAYYVLFNLQDIFDASKAYNSRDYESLWAKTRKAIKNHDTSEVASTLYVNALSLITVAHRIASFGYLGYKLPLQNGAKRRGAFFGAGVAGVATVPAAVYTRDPAIQKRYGYQVEAATKEQNPERKQEIIDTFESDYKRVKTDFEDKPLSKKLCDETQYLFLSPSIFLIIPVAFYAFVFVAYASQSKLNQTEATVVAASTSTAGTLLAQLVFRHPAKRRAIVNRIAEEKAESDTTLEAESKKPNRCATITAYASNFADQFLRTAATVPQILTLFGYNVLDPDLMPNRDIVLLTFCAAALIGSGNMEYMAPKTEASLPQISSRLFARKNKQGLLDSEVSSELVVEFKGPPMPSDL